MCPSSKGSRGSSSTVLSTTRFPRLLVQWEEESEIAATWEDVLTIKDQFLDFHLEEKVVEKEESIVRPTQNTKIWKAYVRRKLNNRKTVNVVSEVLFVLYRIPWGLVYI